MPTSCTTRLACSSRGAWLPGGTLGNDFGLFGLVLPSALQARYPAWASGLEPEAVRLNMARNVQWGLDTVEDEVIDACDSGFGKQVVVAATLEGADEPVTATFRAEAVELAA